MNPIDEILALSPVMPALEALARESLSGLT